MNRRALFFALAVAVQLLILLAIPAQKIYTRAVGRSVMLQTLPVDPYNLLSGYYVTLNYEIANPELFSKSDNIDSGKEVYAILERRTDGAWHPVSLSESLPTGLPENRIAIRGRYNYSRIEYGIEQFFIPEEKRGEIEDGLRANRERPRVEVKVDSQGNAALVRLLIEDRVYNY